MNALEYTRWGNVVGEPLSCAEAQRRDDWRQGEEWAEQRRNLTYDELKDLGVPGVSIARLRSCDLHKPEDPADMIGPIYGGTVRRGV